MRYALRVRRFALLTLPIVFAWACLGKGPSLIGTDDAGAPPQTDLGDDSGVRADVNLGDPFSLIGLDPSHGPWSGGTRTLLAGRGFSSRLRVLVASKEVPSSDLFASDPTRAALTTPPGDPGVADVTILDDGTKETRTLKAAFTYDAFEVVPNSGATSGGTRIALRGASTTWATGTTVAVDGHPCTGVAVTDATHLECTTPANPAGSKDVTVTNPDLSQTQARDAFVYSDSADGFRGGLSGGVLSGSIKVIALDAYTGMSIPGAKAIAGNDANTAIVGTTDLSGVAQLKDPSLKGKVTITVAGKCHSPTSFVDVPVDTVTVYLDPVLDPSCGQGDPPTGGGKGRDLGAATGELIWPTGTEFQARGEWIGVPLPIHSDERRAAYVFAAVSNPDSTFYLPDPMSATTMDSNGTYGFGYTTVWYPGNITLYAVAGIERNNSTGRTFIPYMMGVQRGVPLQPTVVTTHVDINMNTLLDHSLVLDTKPPPTTNRGPDRLVARAAVSLGQGAYALFNVSPQTKMLPTPGLVSFVGLPAMAGSFASESYVVSASAVSGSKLDVPLSVVSHVRTNDANVPLALTGFLPVPKPISPSNGVWDGMHVDIAATGTIDLALVVVSSGGGIEAWTVVSPGNKSFTLPNLEAIGPDLAIPHGAIQTSVQIARIDSFSYAKLRYGQLYSSAWNAYAADRVSGVY